MEEGTIDIAVDIAKFVHHSVRNIFMRLSSWKASKLIFVAMRSSLQICIIKLRDFPTSKSAIAELVREFPKKGSLILDPH